MESNILSIKNPELFLEIHPTKNVGVDLEALTFGSNKKIWWICKVGHEWEADVTKRAGSTKRGCPYCKGKKACDDNCLATIHPELIKEWDYIKNVNLTPETVTSGSGKIVWWICDENHSWEVSIDKRCGRGHGCPYCSGKRVCEDNCLATINPELCKEWNYNKNVITPYDVVPFSTKKVWWICEQGHEYEARISNRSSGTKCKKCVNPNVSEIERKIYYFMHLVFGDAINSHKIYPEGKKSIETDIFIPSLNTAIEYDGIYYHKSEFKVQRDIGKNKRIDEEGIKLIRLREVGLPPTGILEFTHFSNIKNGLKTLIVEVLNYLKLNYALNESHIENIDYVQNLDFKNHKIDKEFFTYQFKENSLFITDEALSSEWDYERNGSLTPKNVTKGSGKKVWWICSKNGKHKWESIIGNRSKGDGCPYCSGKIICDDNSLSFFRKDLSEQWNYEKNGNLRPTEVTLYSNKKIWWICKEGHQWEETIANRTTKKCGCPYCSGRRKTTS